VGAPAIRYFFEHYDLTGFDPFADPPMSADKLAAIGAGDSGIESIAQELMQDAERPTYCDFDKLWTYVNYRENKPHSQLAVANAYEKAGAVSLGRWRALPKQPKIRVYSLDPDAKNTQEDATAYLSKPEHQKTIEACFRLDGLKC
jgi:hypothetical protein